VQHLFGPTLQRISYFKHTSTAFLVQVCRAIKPMLLAPREPLNRSRTLYVLEKGLAVWDGRVLAAGAFVGADFMLRNPDLRHTTFPTVLTFSELLTLHRAELEEVMQNFPSDTKLVRTGVMWTALKTWLAKLGREVMVLQGRRSSSAGGRGGGKSLLASMGSPGRREASGSATASRQRVLAQLQAEMATARERVVAAPLDGVGGGSDSGGGGGNGDGSRDAPSPAADTGEALSPFRRLSSGRFSSSPKHVAQKGRHAFRPPPVGAATSYRAGSFDHGSTTKPWKVKRARLLTMVRVSCWAH
jgi:hypothetical protein